MHEAHEAARALLVEHAARLGVEELSGLAPREDGRSELTLKLEVEGERIALRVVLPVAFPYSEIELVLDSPEWQGRAHQNSAGKICPRPDAIVSHDASRLIEAIQAAREWLGAAKNGTLAPDGERYELPEVQVRRADWLLLFDEEFADYVRWAAHRGASGPASVVQHAGGWAIEQCRTADGAVIAQRASIREPVKPVRVSGRWIVIDAFSSKGHRVARTWDELRAVFADLERVVRQAWNDAEGELAFVLVGMPMPEAWGGMPSRMHWQPIVFPSYQVARAEIKAASRTRGRRINGRHLAPMALWPTRSPLVRGESVPWAFAEDVSRARLYVRSGSSGRAFEAPLIIGAGAIGSAIADILVRGGLRDLAIIDRDRLEYGNLCRHVLDGASIREPKALALAAHLRLVSPSVRTRAFGASLPPQTSTDKQSFDEALAAADLVIDASGDDEVLDWLGSLATRSQVASVWTNSDASVGVAVLAGLGGGANVADLRVFAKDAIDAGRVPGVSSGAHAGPKPIVPGTGCWHPTFHGSWSRLVALGAAFCEWLTTAARGSRDGRIVVFRFAEGTWHRARSWSVPRKQTGA
jgi:hypothetical protein